MKKNAQLLHVLLVASLFFCLAFSRSHSNADSGFMDNPDAVEKAANSVFMLEVYSADHHKIGVGSGFLAFDSHIMVTNYHVIEGGSYLVAISDDNEQIVITKVISYDKEKDIALLYFDEIMDLDPLELDAEDGLKRAQKVIAIGSPAGLINTISIGNISALYNKDGKDWIQFTAPISSGSSGGALLNDQGEVIGITTATYVSAQNINIAVKVKHAIDLFRQWDGRTIISLGYVTDAPKVSEHFQLENSVTESSTVYVTPGGKKYHNNPTCSKMKSPLEMELLDAIQKGYEPCSKCYK